MIETENIARDYVLYRLLKEKMIPLAAGGQRDALIKLFSEKLFLGFKST